MRLCGRHRGSCDSYQFSVIGIQFQRKKPVVPSTVFPMPTACRVRLALVCCLAWGKRRSEDRPLHKVRKKKRRDEARLYTDEHIMALENCKLCRGSGWKLVPRGDGAAGSVGVACDGARANSEALRTLRF